MIDLAKLLIGLFSFLGVVFSAMKKGMRAVLKSLKTKEKEYSGKEIPVQDIVVEEKVSFGKHLANMPKAAARKTKKFFVNTTVDVLKSLSDSITKTKNKLQKPRAAHMHEKSYTKVQSFDEIKKELEKEAEPESKIEAFDAANTINKNGKV